MNKPAVCGYCRWWRFEDMPVDGVCCCDGSENFGLTTKQDHACEEFWEEEDGFEGYDEHG